MDLEIERKHMKIYENMAFDHIYGPKRAASEVFFKLPPVLRSPTP